MIRWQLHLLWPLTATILALTGLALYVLTSSPARYRLKIALIPAVLAAALASFLWFGETLGYAAPAKLPPKFEYLTHKIIVEDGKKAWIDILVVSRKPLERDARLHRVPWSDELEKALKQAAEMKRGGGTAELDRFGDEYPKWVPRRVLPQDEAPKDPIPHQDPPADLLAPRPGMTV